ncbi:succinate-CoA ligase, partial [Choiromyces venosus 120613-1]
MYRVTPTTCLRPRRYFQQHGRWSSTYDQTLKNLTLTSETRIIYQGFTGKQATANAMQSIDYGTKVVGGVTPRKSGQHLKLPLFSSVKEAADNLKPHATAIFVPAPFAVSAITESIAAEIPLIIAVAEHVSIHSLLRLHSILKTQSRSRLVGANCPGIINPAARCRVGFMPHKVFTPGVVGIVAKSGTLSYEAVASTSRAGLGQSLVVGMGGDWIAGTTLVDGVKFFLEDEGTKGIVVIGEVGGDVEMRVVALLEEVKGRNGGALTKPVMGLVAGLTAQEGKVMGHAGAIRAPGDPTVEEKIKALSRAGVEMVSQPAQFGPGMVKLL